MHKTYLLAPLLQAYKTAAGEEVDTIKVVGFSLDRSGCAIWPCGRWAARVTSSCFQGRCLSGTFFPLPSDSACRRCGSLTKINQSNQEQDDSSLLFHYRGHTETFWSLKQNSVPHPSALNNLSISSGAGSNRVF